MATNYWSSYSGIGGLKRKFSAMSDEDTSGSEPCSDEELELAIIPR